MHVHLRRRKAEEGRIHSLGAGNEKCVCESAVSDGRDAGGCLREKTCLVCKNGLDIAPPPLSRLRLKSTAACEMTVEYFKTEKRLDCGFRRFV